MKRKKNVEMMIYHRKRGNDEMIVQSLEVLRKVRGSMIGQTGLDGTQYVGKRREQTGGIERQRGGTRIEVIVSLARSRSSYGESLDAV